MRYLAIGTSGLIGLVFLVSSLSKVRGRDAVRAFVRSVRDMRVLPAALVAPAATLVIVAELAVWLLLAIPVAAAAIAGLLVAIGLLVPFTVAIGSVRWRGLRASCRCFGRPATAFRTQHLVRNAFLLCVAVVGLVAWTTPGEASTGGALVCWCTGLLVGAVVTVLDDVIDLFRPVDMGSGRP
jgi:hypothetical protein